MRKPLFSQRFITLLLVSTFLVFLLIFWGNYYRRIAEAREEQKRRMELVARGVMERVATIDKLYQAFELSADKEMKPLLEKIAAEYDRTGIIPENLAGYTEKNSEIHLYVIDPANTVVATTNPNDKGLDFTPYPDFVRLLNHIRSSGSYINPRFSQSIHDGGMIKYAYLPSRDTTMIFEASLNLSAFEPFMGTDSFAGFISELALSEREVVSVTPFTSGGIGFAQTPGSHPLEPERLEQINLATKLMQPGFMEHKTANFTTFYRYYPYKFEDPLYSNSMIIEIVFTDRLNRLDETRHTHETLVASIVFLLLIAGIHQYFIVRFIKPLSSVLATVERIRQNDFSARAAISMHNETGILAERINEMIEHIGSLLEEKNTAQGKLTKLLDEHEKGFFETVKALAYSIDAKDPYTGGHCERVMSYALLIGTQLGLSGTQLETLRYGAILHDVGKIGISDQVLNKTGEFTPLEITEMRRHPDIGFQIIREIDFLAGARNIVRCHHEKFDGTGYPNGLSGENIPLLARIVCIADAFDAMTSYRHYRTHHMTVGEALEEMNRLAGIQFDPALVACFILVHETRRAEFPLPPEPVLL